MSHEQDKETYLGDGLYASFDGYQIKLRVPTDLNDQEIYLEPEVYNNLLKFVDDLHEENNR